MGDITIKDIANAAGVSIGTVSMALNDKTKVNAKTKKKVMKVAEQLGYKPNKYARVLISKRTHTVGLIVTDITNPFYGLIIDYAQQELEKCGYDLMLGISGGNTNKESKIVDNFINLRVDGVIMVPSHNQPAETRHFDELRKRNIPLCFITSYYAGIDAPCVMTDLGAGSYGLTRHVLESGCRNIIYIVANPSLPLAALRLDGYRSALREAGIQTNPEGVVTAEEATFDCGYEAAGKILDSMAPDAILTINDIMALGVLKRLKERGYRVPEDISLAGYDDLIYSALSEIPLTTVSQPVRSICSRTVEILLRIIDEPQPVGEKVFLAPQLIVRKSTISI